MCPPRWHLPSSVGSSRVGSVGAAPRAAPGVGEHPQHPRQAENGHNSLHLGPTRSGTPGCGHKTPPTPLILNHGGFAPKTPPWGRTHIHQQKWGKSRGFFFPPFKPEG